MHVDPAQPWAPQSAIFNEAHDGTVRSRLSGKQRCKISQNRSAVGQISACKLACYERMRNNSTVDKQISETRVPGAQMRNPDRRIRKYCHALRRRDVGESFGCVPPGAASRLPASREIGASKPALTRAVFSFMPVASLARCNNTSSMMTVVLMRVIIQIRCIPKRWPVRASGI